MDIANAAKCIFCCQFPNVAEAMGWERGDECPECGDQSMITLE